MTIKYFKYYVKSTLTNPYVIGWGVIFVLFWALMGAFVFSAEVKRMLPHIPEVMHYELLLRYTASWYGVLVKFTFAALAINLVYTFFFSMSSVIYTSKFTKMKLARFYGYNVTGSLLTFLIPSLLMTVLVYGLYSYSLGMNLPPKNVPLLAASSVSAGALLYFLAMVLTLSCIVARRPRLITLMSFVPLILTFALSYGQIYGYLGSLGVHISPYNNILSLHAYAYSGMDVPVVFVERGPEMVDLRVAALSLFSWIVALALVSKFLFKVAKGISPHEIRAL